MLSYARKRSVPQGTVEVRIDYQSYKAVGLAGIPVSNIRNNKAQITMTADFK